MPHRVRDTGYFFVPIRGTHLRARDTPEVDSFTPVTSLICPAGHDPSSTMMRWPRRRSAMSCSRATCCAAAGVASASSVKPANKDLENGIALTVVRSPRFV
ncbi:MAG: hypothetical protein QOH32_1658 [Bradyrhizobium sp.]|nr:hypothetical protein [Bradyrhizobium sp.]